VSFEKSEKRGVELVAEASADSCPQKFFRGLTQWRKSSVEGEDQ
jgi:hypothetical protein